MTRDELDALDDGRLAVRGIYRRNDGTYMRAVYAWSPTARRVAIDHYEPLTPADA